HTCCAVDPMGMSTQQRNHRGRAPMTATSLALTTTANRPAAEPVKVMGSVAATTVPSGTWMAQASSPTAGPTTTSPGIGGSAWRMAVSTSVGSFPAARGRSAMAGRMPHPERDPQERHLVGLRHRLAELGLESGWMVIARMPVRGYAVLIGVPLLLGDVLV